MHGKRVTRRRSWRNAPTTTARALELEGFTRTTARHLSARFYADTRRRRWARRTLADAMRRNIHPAGVFQRIAAAARERWTP